MATPQEGEKPQNIVPVSLRVAPEQRLFHGVKTPEAMRQQRADPELEAYRRLLKEPRGSAVFENPIRVPRPLPRNPGEQRGEAEPFQTNPAGRLGKPSSEVVASLVNSSAQDQGEPRELPGGSYQNQGEQDINLILPSYIRRMDRNDRELISYKLVPDREFLEEMGWDNFAELSLDLSSSLPKPEDPTYEPDYSSRKESQWLSQHLTANEWEKTIVDSLEAQGASHLAPQFKQDMGEYRKAVKSIVEMWRKSGLL